MHLPRSPRGPRDLRPLCEGRDDAGSVKASLQTRRASALRVSLGAQRKVLHHASTVSRVAPRLRDAGSKTQTHHEHQENITQAQCKTPGKKPEPAVTVTPVREYTVLISNIGSLLKSADLLGVHPTTLKRRLDGQSPLTREMFLAAHRAKESGNFVSPI